MYTWHISVASIANAVLLSQPGNNHKSYTGWNYQQSTESSHTEIKITLDKHLSTPVQSVLTLFRKLACYLCGGKKSEKVRNLFFLALTHSFCFLKLSIFIGWRGQLCILLIFFQSEVVSFIACTALGDSASFYEVIEKTWNSFLIELTVCLPLLLPFLLIWVVNADYKLSHFNDSLLTLVAEVHSFHFNLYLSGSLRIKRYTIITHLPFCQPYWN